MKKQPRKTYIKLFNIPEIAQRAMNMLSENPPRTYSYIANKLGCDRSSVVHFHKKKIKEELSLKNFNGVKIELIGGIKPEVINIGKSYKDYCKKYIKKRDKIQSKRMKEAKKTLDKLNKNRVEYKMYTEFDIW